MNFIEALRLCDAGLAEWKSKPHNARWWKRIDGTPIPNDLLVCIAQVIADTAQPSASGRVPEGWVLVPKEPTDWMMRAGAQDTSFVTRIGAASVYKAMLASAPRAPLSDEGAEG